MTDKKGNDPQNRILVVLSVFIGVLFMLLTSAAIELTEILPWVASLIGSLLFIGSETAMYYAFRQKDASEYDSNADSFSTLMSEAVREVEFPVVITTADGRIIWANKSMLGLFGKDRQPSVTGQMLEKYTGVASGTVYAASKPDGIRIEMSGRSFRAMSYLMENDSKDYWMTVFGETTRLDEEKKKTRHESPAIAYIALDNLDEIARYTKASHRSTASEIEPVLREWVSGLGGFIRDYVRDRYVAVFPGDSIDACLEDGFSSVGTVREKTAGEENMPVTVSVGVCAGDFPLKEKERAAHAALETAMQRGGDQAVVRTEGGMQYFGGKTKTEQKRGKIGSRVVADRLKGLITKAGNVIIMGHSNPDFDCIGATIGLCRLALCYNPEVKIVTDRKNKNFRICTRDLFEKNPDASKLFIGADEGMDLIKSDTLVIVADVNNLKITEAPQIVENAAQLVIIDHHRKVADFVTEPEISYIEPAASSCCELVSELIQLSGESENGRLSVSRQEVNIMLSGIMLDTKNFTRSVTEETFSAALYLRGIGASPEVARTFFYDDYSGFVTESKLDANVRMYRDRIAVTVTDVDEISPDARISASRSAEAMLTIREVEAAFAIVKSPDTVLISARSNGKVNVQLILEKLGGGGHFDSAGAQLTGASTRDVMETLKEAIDSFIDSGI